MESTWLSMVKGVGVRGVRKEDEDESEKKVSDQGVSRRCRGRRGGGRVVVKWEGHDDVGWMSLIFVDW